MALPAWSRVPRTFLGHEWTLAAAGGLALSALANRALLAHFGHVLPRDNGDASTAARLIAEGGRKLPPNFPNLLLGYAPFGIGADTSASAVPYLIVALLAGTLAFLGLYALVRQLGGGRIAAISAGVAVTFAPWHLGPGNGQPVIGMAGMALALAMLARGHDLRWRRLAAPGSDLETRRYRPGWALAGWLVAAWQVTVSLAAGVVLAYIVFAGAFVALAHIAWRRWRAGVALPSWLVAADSAGILTMAAALVAMRYPYGGVFSHTPTVAELDPTSAPPLGLVIAPAHDWLWGGVHAGARALLPDPASMALLPGYALYAIAAAGLIVSVWPWRVRLGLLAGTALALIVTLGTRGPLPRFAFVDVIGGVPGLRTLTRPHDLIGAATLLLAMLAAGGIGALVVRASEVARSMDRRRPTVPAYLGLLVPAVLLLVEGLGVLPTAPA
jgi:hypothetical protein